MYINMVEADKNGPFEMTPLSICMNSSMNQPLLWDKPKCLLAKDISKFYQCVESDEVSQHIVRVLLRLGT